MLKHFIYIFGMVNSSGFDIIKSFFQTTFLFC